MTAPRCPRCDIGLSEGFLLEEGDHHSRAVTQWVEGAPQRSFWRGLDLRGRMKLPVNAHRCPRCGYLELYVPAATPDGR